MKEAKKLIFLFVPLFMLFTAYIEAKEVVLSNEAQSCFDCHGQRGIVKEFENNDSVEVYVDEEKFKTSVHNFLTCSDCHTEFSAEKHPKRRFRSKEQYEVRSSLICRKCHSMKKIRTGSIHASLLKEEKEGKIHICTNCHGSHSIVQVDNKEVYSSKEKYCLNCHSHELSRRFPNGEVLSPKIDVESLQSSVHNMLNCSDCHFGFSSEEHPTRNFKTKRDKRIAFSENCRRCHFDKYTEVQDSIHYEILKQGNLKAPVCTDCHGSHSIVQVDQEKMFTVVKCKKCHSEIYDTYSKSVHGKALFIGDLHDVPVCTDCHNSHKIKNPLAAEYYERIPEMCGNCHSNKAIMGKYGLSTEVLKTYLSDFHGVTLEFYKKQKEAFYKPARPIAVCTDCHGIHNISSNRGTDAKTIKTNLLKRCQKCHENATENFPDAWLYHYKPSFARTPMVYISSMIYKVLIPVTLIGLVLQILLHIWRYSVNR